VDDVQDFMHGRVAAIGVSLVQFPSDFSIQSGQAFNGFCKIGRPVLGRNVIMPVELVMSVIVVAGLFRLLTTKQKSGKNKRVDRE